MQAIRIISPGASAATPYSVTNPAPSSALELVHDAPIPAATEAGSMLIRVHASAVIRDELTWPETYIQPRQIPGHDFSGVVESVCDDGSGAFKPGDEIYGMVDASRGAIWAEYAIVRFMEAAPKPKLLSWEEAAALPLSALTAWQALFAKARLEAPDFDGAKSKGWRNKRVLITGAAGGVGLYMVQFAVLAGYVVLGATSSNARNAEFLISLGADATYEYSQLGSGTFKFDTIIDTVGGDVLKQCWTIISDAGDLITVDSASFDFVNQHAASGLSAGKEQVHAEFFIVEPSREDLAQITRAVDMKAIEAFVAATFPLKDAREAYEKAHGRSPARGKIVLNVGS